MICQRTTSRRRGAVAPFVAVSLLTLTSVMALALDGGLLMHQRQRGRTAADAAALAAADNLFLHYPRNSGLDLSGSAKQAALSAAAAVGYANDGADSTVTVNIPPLSGNFVGKAGYAEVLITYNQPRAFSALWGSGRLPVTSRAVARGLWNSNGNGIIVLNPTMPSALNMNGGGALNVLNATVIVDSNNASAAATGGGGSVATASMFKITGGYTLSNGASFVGTIQTGTQPVPDPLAYLTEPDPSTMTVQSKKKLSISNGDTTLQPGVYKGGIQLSGSANVTLEPGIYYMDTGGFSIGGGVTLVGNGVMIYNAPSPKSNSDVININGNNGASVTLSPPTSGPYKGISLFQDRTSTQSLSVAGNGNFNITGTFYAAKANLTVAGNSATSMGSQYISDSLTVTGTTATNITWNQNSTAQQRIIGLVE
jgi:hypothetical protein